MALEDREARITAVAESVETDMELLGATAVEDKLQVWQGVSWRGKGGRRLVCGGCPGGVEWGCGIRGCRVLK